jgi:hypothetical protein
MLRRRPWLTGSLLLLYVATWVGGWVSHSRELKAQTEAHYRVAQEREQEYASAARAQGSQVPIHARTHPGGPTSAVVWCLPVLPGVLLAYSCYSVGPLHAGGYLQLVLWYGAGSAKLGEVVWWIA